MQKVSKQFAKLSFVLSVVFSMKGVKMRYQVSGKQIDMGTALQQHVKSEIDEVVSKYAERPTDAIVVFSKSGHEFVCEATVHLSTGLTAQARSHENEIYASFDSCAAKMEKQLRRYKRRLKTTTLQERHRLNFPLLHHISSCQNMKTKNQNQKIYSQSL